MLDSRRGNLALSSTRASSGALTDGMRLGAGPGAATFVLGLAYGAAASAAGWGGAVPLVFSILACSGSAQFTLLTTLPAGGAVAAVAAAVLINARYLVMSVALNDSLRGGRLRRALQAQALLDASFAVGHRGNGRFDLARVIGASIPQWLCWVGGTAVGAAGLARALRAPMLLAVGCGMAVTALLRHLLT